MSCDVEKPSLAVQQQGLQHILRSLQDIEQTYKKSLRRMETELIADLDRVVVLTRQTLDCCLCQAEPLARLGPTHDMGRVAPSETLRQEKTCVALVDSDLPSSTRNSANGRSRFTEFDSVTEKFRAAISSRSHPSRIPEASQDDCPSYHKARTVSRWLLELSGFELAFGMVILANSATIGIDIQYRLEGRQSTYIDISEHVFLVIYTIELLIRFLARGWSVIFDPWVSFDVILVFVGLMDAWVIQPLVKNDGDMDEVFVLKVFRLARLLRTLRIYRRFRVIVRLANGILSSGGTVLSTVGVLFLSLYLFACLGVEIITQDDLLRSDPSLGYSLDDRFGSLFRTLLTLVQFVTMDSIGSLYVPLIVRKPILSVYFMIIIVIVSITIMNLVTALIVDRAMQQSYADAEKEKGEQQAMIKGLTNSLRAAFAKLDRDSSNAISAEEIQGIELNELPQCVRDRLGAENMQELFEMLDEDESGDVNEAEFLNGILSVLLEDTPVELVRLVKYSRLQRHMSVELKSIVEDTACTVGLLVDRFNEQFPTPVAI